MKKEVIDRNKVFILYLINQSVKNREETIHSNHLQYYFNYLMLLTDTDYIISLNEVKDIFNSKFHLTLINKGPKVLHPGLGYGYKSYETDISFISSDFEAIEKLTNELYEFFYHNPRYILERMKEDFNFDQLEYNKMNPN